MGKFKVLILILALVALVSLGLAQAAKNDGRLAPAPKEHNHVMLRPEEIKWETPPPSTLLPPWLKVAILQGDPTKSGEHYTMRILHPDGTKVPPHWHPTDENLVVITGNFMMAVGEKYDETSLRDMPVGSYGRMPKDVPHYALARGETIVEVHGVGPFVANKVNPKSPFEGAIYKYSKPQD